MTLNLRNKGLAVIFLICVASTILMYSQEQDANFYYLGVLRDGYPSSMVNSELRFAKAKVCGMTESIVLFGIDEKTQLTTFLKKLPFLAEIYVDAEEIDEKNLLKKNPLFQKFRLLNNKKNPIPGHSKDKENKKTTVMQQEVDKPSKAAASTGNMVLIDKLIREKAVALRKDKEFGKIKKTETRQNEKEK